MKKLILTADDFGVHDFIDRGIREAALARCINTVSAIMVWPGAVDRIKELHNELELQNIKVEFGIHLTLTSGKPLTGNSSPSLVRPDGNFWDVSSYDYDRVNMFEVYNECDAQVQEFLKTGLQPSHLSCHHGIMALFPDFFKIYILIAAKYDLPIRQPLLISRLRIRGFKRSAMKREGLFRGVKIAIFNGADQVFVNIGNLNKRGIERKMKVFNNGSAKPPDYFIDTFYKKGTKRRLKKILRNLVKDKKSELAVHLGLGEYIDNPEERHKYTGINFNYFDGRKKELDTITNKLNIDNYIKQHNDIELGKY